MNYNLKILILLAVILQSCWSDRGTPNFEYMPNMYESLSYEAYSENDLYEDNLSARLPVEGTIPRGYSLYKYEDNNEGYDLAKQQLTNPYDFDEVDMLKAKELYNIYCGVCHGSKGAGQGILVKREKILGIPSYADPGRGITPGSTYHVIYYGRNTMGSYANQLNDKERWMVTNYVMKLKSDLSK
tara:strand:- start:4725 stop:5279 length:555 start_codon:yes stop_codon:yes gene_type:complete